MYPAFFLVALLVIAQATPIVTVSLDRGWYQPGEEVLIHIHATGEHSSISLLWLYIDGPDGRNLYFTDLPFRSQKLNWTIPIDAILGSYTVTVTWDHRYSETDFVVEGQPIPEFPFAPLVLIFAAAIAFLALPRREASARSETLGAHP
jgi:hypothetical protein